MADPAVIIDDIKAAAPIANGSDNGASSRPTPAPASRIVHRAIQSLGHLSNFLPTGTALVFQFLLPIVSGNGKCTVLVDKYMTGILLAVCATSCCGMSFTDTFTAADGSSYYGIATAKGLWIPTGAPPDVAAAAARAGKYKLRPSDFLHAALSVLVFAASSLLDPDVTGCFMSKAGGSSSSSSSSSTVVPARLQESLPIVVAFLASLLLLLFPSTRRGFDEPPASDSSDQTVVAMQSSATNTTTISKPLLE